MYLEMRLLDIFISTCTIAANAYNIARLKSTLARIFVNITEDLSIKYLQGKK